MMQDSDQFSGTASSMGFWRSDEADTVMQNGNTAAWLALTAALLGWMFDGLEMGLFPQVARPLLMDLLNTTDDKVIGRWFGVATASFLVGAATGGVLFGWLTAKLFEFADRLLNE